MTRFCSSKLTPMAVTGLRCGLTFAAACRQTARDHTPSTAVKSMVTRTVPRAAKLNEVREKGRHRRRPSWTSPWAKLISLTIHRPWCSPGRSGHRSIRPAGH
jgi:hypothetical protein